MMIDTLCRSIYKLLLNSAAFYIFWLVFIYRKKKEWTLWHQQTCLVMEMSNQDLHKTKDKGHCFMVRCHPKVHSFTIKIWSLAWATHNSRSFQATLGAMGVDVDVE